MQMLCTTVVCTIMIHTCINMCVCLYSHTPKGVEKVNKILQILQILQESGIN